MSHIEFQFTDAERSFVDHYFYETATATEGPAIRWMREHEIKSYELASFEKIRWAEDPDLAIKSLDLGEKEFQIPWDSADSLRARLLEAKTFLEKFKR